VDDFSLAAELVRDAGALANRMLGQGLETKYKTSISDVVSAADHAAEELVVGRLAESRPEDALVGEEGARHEGNGRTWYIDPVDGTYNFLCGTPYWCSAIGLVDEDGPVAGAVYYPAVDQLWVGGRDHPTTLNGTPVPPLADRPLADLSVATYFNPRNLGDSARLDAWTSVIRASATVRMLGSASVDMAGVASGRLGVFLQANLNPWDWFPGAALVIGAGGVADTLQRGEILWQLAGNRQAVADAKAALQSA
jgi:fructose-1,6-bisphosphatase/inositol monophosphatase family enzyme